MKHLPQCFVDCSGRPSGVADFFFSSLIEGILTLPHYARQENGYPLENAQGGIAFPISRLGL